MKDNKLYHALLTAGHFCSDINGGSLASILPFLIAAYNFNYTTAATLVFFSNLIGSIVQPFFGHMADKHSFPWMMGVAILLAGGGMGLTGFMSSYAGIAVCVMISGVGNALFHPEATRLVNRLAPKKQTGKFISIFSFGGNLGYTIGPILVTAAITGLGLKGTGFLAIPALITCGFIFAQSKNLSEKAINERMLQEIRREVYEGENPTLPTGTINPGDSDASLLPKTKEVDQWKSFGILTLFVFGRSIVLTSVCTFLPLYFINVLGQTKVVANMMLTLYYTASTITTLFGGALADKYGYVKVVKLAFLMMAVSIGAFSISRNFWLSALILIPIASGMNLSYSPIVVLGQKYLPNQIGLASGLTQGLAMSLGGLMSPVIGMIGDNYGLEIAIYMVAAFSIIPLILSLFLPQPVESKE